MCYPRDQSSWSRDRFFPSARSDIGNAVAVYNIGRRLAEIEASLERARAREAELSRRLEVMKRFISVMAILKKYLESQYREKFDLSQLRTPEGSVAPCFHAHVVGLKK